MPLTVQDIVNEIYERKAIEVESMRSSKIAGINSPGFNQDLGHHAALRELLRWIEDQS